VRAGEKFLSQGTQCFVYIGENKVKKKNKKALQVEKKVVVFYS